jgi:F0F1-type ATP synthase delta subunit
MRTKDYIDATYDLVKAGGNESETLTKLKSYLERKGLSKLYPSVLRGLMEKVRRKNASTRTKIVLARESDASLHKDEIASAVASIGVTEHDVVIDDTIIGGFIVKGKNERLDQSYKHKLLHVYHKITD